MPWDCPAITSLQGFDMLPREGNFPPGDTYGTLILMAKQNYSFWSSLKKCYKQKRADIKANNVSCTTKRYFQLTDLFLCMSFIDYSEWLSPHNKYNLSS